MFKKVASDALGLSDIGKIIGPEDFDKTQSDDYVRHEDGETIKFLIMSKSDEYCFTNLAMIHVDGQNAVSSKRELKRYPYFTNPISNVMLETAGKMDLDVEIKFTIGHQHFSIDVNKNQLEQLKDLYKALCRIEEIQQEADRYIQIGEDSLHKASEILKNTKLSDVNLTQQYKELADVGFDWLSTLYEKRYLKDFGFVFDKYINN
jgi:Bacterial PH domain/YvbH-like oligomerisation region